MMKKRLLVYLFVGAIAGVSICKSIVVEASEFNLVSCYQISSAKNNNVVRAVVIKKKYRIFHGRRQYRRWDETNGKWVDPEWIDE